MAASDASESQNIVLSDNVLPEASSQLSPPEPTLEIETEDVFSWGWDVTFASQYLWQGIDYSDEKPVIQPEFVLNYRDFSAALWFNYDTHERVANEWDLYLQYTLNLSRVSLSPGYAYFDYPHHPGTAPTQEVFVDASLNIPLRPSFGVHYDFDSGQGFYETLGIRHETGPSLGNLSLETILYLQNAYYDMTGIPSLEWKVSRGFTIKSLTLIPSISYFLTWENGDFAESAAVPDSWLFTLNVVQY